MTPRSREAGLLLLLLAGGLAHWLLFYGVGSGAPRPSFNAADWPMAARYDAVLQQAAREGRLPYYVAKPIQDSRKFLSNPEVAWSPEVLLLRLMSERAFIIVHTLLLHTVGFLGLLLLRARHRLSLLPFVLLYLLFAFNGHITSHLAIGHSMWTGYFLLPFFFVYVLDLVGEATAGNLEVKLGLVLFAILLQGSWHLFVWCAFFLALLALFERDRAGRVVRALAWAAALSLVRLVPAGLVLFEKKNQMFLSGYPGVEDFLAGLLVVRDVLFERRGGMLGTLNWWEYDAYVGVVGLAWLTWFGLWRPLPAAKTHYRALYGPMIVLALLSLGDLYFPFNRMPIPFLDSERVSSRFLILPLGFLMVRAALAFDERWRQARTGRETALGILAALALAASLGWHSYQWRLAHVEAVWPRPLHPHDLTLAIAEAPAEPTARDTIYQRGVILSALASLGALAAACWRLRPGSALVEVARPGVVGQPLE